MSDMTISQIREARGKAQEQIDEILLSLAQRTGLRISEVTVRSTVSHFIQRRYGETIGVQTTIVLEGP